MKRLSICIIILSFSGLLFSQSQQDSLVLFSGLKYQSEFEKKALTNYVQNKKDTFDLFLAIDENMTDEIAQGYKIIFNNVFTELNKQKTDPKNITRKIKSSYSIVHNQFLKKYSETAYFPSIFKDGTYNCVTASLLFAMVFDQYGIPYKVMSSKDHIYLIANPGNKSVVIETTNPSFENAIFNGDFKQQYVNNLRSSKLISEEDYKNKSVEEIFATKFNDLKESKAINLPGFQYYNKSLIMAQNNDVDKAYDLSLKAYFFYPDKQVKTLLYTTLAFKLDKCEFSKIEDAELIAQYARIDPTNTHQISRLFDQMLAKNIQYTDRINFCDTFYNRLRSIITDKNILDEIGFSYNMTMAYGKNRRFDISGTNIYVRNALKFKPNQRDAISLFEASLQNDLQRTEDYYSNLDSLKKYEKEFENTSVLPIINDYKIMVYLKIAEKAFENNKATEGEKYMSLFENNFVPPIKDIEHRIKIENAYFEYANYYARRKNKAMVDKIISKGLKLIPKSNMIQSARDSMSPHISKMMIAPY